MSSPVAALTLESVKTALSAVLVRWRYRAYFVSLVLAGMVLGVGPYPYDDPPLFGWLQAQGSVAEPEMLRVFNCGIGMVIVVAAQDAAAASALLRRAGETVWQIGTIREQRPGEAQTVVE